LRLGAVLWAGAATGFAGIMVDAFTDLNGLAIPGAALLTPTLMGLVAREVLPRIGILPAARALRAARDAKAHAERNTAGVAELARRADGLEERAQTYDWVMEQTCDIAGIDISSAANAPTMPDRRLRVIRKDAG